MQMQLLSCLDPHCLLCFFYPPFILSVSRFQWPLQKPLHITACTCFSQGGRGALMSLTSITFAGLHVSAPQSASQNHLRHNGRIVRFTIRCLNFEWLPESLPAATPPRKRSHTKHLNFSKSDSSFIIHMKAKYNYKKSKSICFTAWFNLHSSSVLLIHEL